MAAPMSPSVTSHPLLDHHCSPSPPWVMWLDGHLLWSSQASRMASVLLVSERFLQMQCVLMWLPAASCEFQMFEKIIINLCNLLRARFAIQLRFYSVCPAKFPSHYLSLDRRRRAKVHSGLTFTDFSVVWRGGVHTAGWGDLSAREWEVDHQARVQRHWWAWPPDCEHHPTRPGPWAASGLLCAGRPLLWDLPVHQQL